MHDAGRELPVAGQLVAAVFRYRIAALRIHAAGRENERRIAEHLLLHLVGEETEQPVVLHVERRDPAGGRTRFADRDADVDEQIEADLVAAEALRHERTKYAGRLQRLDDVVIRFALAFGIARAARQ